MTRQHRRQHTRLYSRWFVLFAVVEALLILPTTSVDGAAQSALRGAALQTVNALQNIAIVFNWWGGDGVIYFTLLLLIGGRLLKQRGLAEIGLRGAEGIAIASAVSAIIKGLAGRARPFVTPSEPWHWDFAHGWTDAQYFSMPSGHTTATFGFAAAVTFAVLSPRTVTAQWMIGAASFGSAVLVAFARMYADQHWLSDVVAGAIIGIGSGLWLARLHAQRPGSAFDRALLGQSSITA